MKYLLIEVQERKICEPVFFDTQKEAFDEMCSRFAEVRGMTVEAAVSEYYIQECEGEETCIMSTWAWTERFGNNYDWRIFELQCDIHESGAVR